MEWLRKLHGTTVGLDTAPLIYFIEGHPVYLSLVRPFFEAMQRGEMQVVTSTLTLTEVLVHPYRRGDPALARRYSRILLNAPNLKTIAVSPAIADEAARIRAVYGFKTPDSIQLATAQHAAATAFLTNDTNLMATPGMQLIVLDSLLLSLGP
jgi:predicted nucleic acid-binding protein